MFDKLKLRKDFEESQEKKKIEAVSPSGANLIAPKLIEINGCKFIISKMPCTVAQEVIVQLPAGFIPIINNFSKSQEMAFKMLSYCERVYDDRANVPLISKELIDNHVPDFNTLIKLETACINHNYDFFENGAVWNFLTKGLCRAESSLSKILMDSLDKLLQAEKQHSTNSKQSTL